MICNCDAYKFPHRPNSGSCEIPECKDCEFRQVERDPFGTGDKQYSEIHCTTLKCPWGKE